MKPRPSFLLAAAITVACFSARSARADDPKPVDPPTSAPEAAERGYVGFNAVPAVTLPDAARAQLKVPAKGGLVVVKVLPGGPAEKAGLKVGDLLVKYTGQAVPDTSKEVLPAFDEAFKKLTTVVKVGQEVEIVVERDGQPVTIKAVALAMSELTKAAQAAEEVALKNAPGQLGFSVVPAAALTPKQKTHWKVKAEKGLVAVRVLAGGPAAKAGMLDGEVLLKYAGKDLPDSKDVNPKDAASVNTFQTAVGLVMSTVKPGQEVEVIVEREGKPVTLKATAIDGLAWRALAQAAGEDEEDEGDEGDEGGEGKEGPEHK